MLTVHQNKESSPSCTPVSVVMAHSSLAVHTCTQRLCHTSSQSLSCSCWCTLKVAWDHQSNEDHQLGGNNNCPAQHFRKMWSPNSSHQQQWTTLSVFWIWRVPETKWHTVDIGLTLYLPASNGLAEIFVQTFKYSLESSTSWFSATEDTELPTLIQEHSTRLNRIFPIQAVLATRAKDKVILSKTWPGKPRGKKAYDRQAKFQEKAMGDTVLARDHLYVSSQKWQSGTVLEHKFPHSSKFNWMMGEFGSAMLMMCCKTHQALKPQPPVQHLQKLLKQMLLSVIHTLSLLPQLNLAHHHTQTQDQKRLHLLPVLSCVDQGASKKTL